MSQQHVFGATDGDWICRVCGLPLEQRKARAHYMGGAFDLSIPCCPKCGQYFVPRELARGKMRELEKILEDK